MAPGLYGADIEQLRSLSKSMGLSGSRLSDTEHRINGLVASTAWKGADAGRFRSEWTGTLRPMLNKATQSLIDASKLLLTQADEQQEASTQGDGAGSGPGGPAHPAGPGVAGDNTTTGLEGILSGAGSTPWWAANGAATGAGLYADDLLATMAKGGLVTKLTNWPILSAQYGQAAEAGYVRGTQLLNGTSMLGRLSGGLGIVTGGLQLTQGLSTGNTGMAIDGGISTVLAAGSFIPGAGPFFAVAGIAWGGMGLLAGKLGYGSASEMIGDAAENTAEAVADGAKKVWGWLT
ncbi:WXG100 family type VII secretion target [Arthrobacter sp. SO3]|uniref:WXG100 family type VII secretion target n=1 Tax=Arthrobacter sp. SO3 TaxID=1897057 RepID=UPI001CFFBF44|nr:hypothetical protein [Arthrobacter sp. SO3]MCB5294597.1 hypothetical protein [Arthrobacter sp. SO3]